jgi:hypothetical protein
MDNHQVREGPILFRGPMVRAVLREIDPKTQTRRVVKAELEHQCLHPPRFFDTGDGWACEHCGHGLGTMCPYGVPGDRLWVRENFQPLYDDDTDWRRVDYKTGKGYRVSYPATDGIVEFHDEQNDDSFCDRVTPSIHMPRWASRSTLEITEVRVQRLREISEEDAIAEGIEGVDVVINGRSQGWTWRDYESGCNDPCEWFSSPINSFRTLWDSINAKPKRVKGDDGGVSHYVSYPWAGEPETRTHRGKPWLVVPNPWVWALTFRRLRGS